MISKMRPIPASISGWMFHFELEWLYDQAMFLRDQGVPGDLLEVGSYKGLSASALGQAGALTCIDTFMGGEDLPERSSREQFYTAMRQMELNPRVIVGRSRTGLFQLREEDVKFRLILIDASHRYENVYEDLRSAWRLLSPEGMLVADDYIGFADVRRACDEFGGFMPVDLQRSKMAYVRKLKSGVS